MQVKDVIKELSACDGDAFFFLESTYQPYAGARPVTDIYRITEIYGRGAPHARLEYCGEKPDVEDEMMDINELKNLYTKVLYQDALDLDDGGARYILQDLVGDEINRMRKPCEWCEGNVSKYFDTNWYDFTSKNTGARPKAKFCPNCGREIKKRHE